jgi:1-acyl-sn-glycerol-3-phosphate acyltransferase
MKPAEGHRIEGDTQAPPQQRPTRGKAETGAKLGRDPFEEDAGCDPFLEGLAATGEAPPTLPDRDEIPPGSGSQRPPEIGTSPGPSAASPPISTASPGPPDAAAETAEPGPGGEAATRAQATRPRPGRRTSTPRLSEVELPEVSSWLERWLGPDERRRLAALAHLVESETAYDRFGLSPEVVRRSFPYFYALYRFYFRVQSQGGEHLPSQGPALLASNHAGVFPFDGAMLLLDILLTTDPPRLARAIVDRFTARLPWLNVFLARVGQVVESRENFAELLQGGEMVLVFPEGLNGVRKPISQRYRLQRFQTGFVEEALRTSVPIVPVAVIGSDDQTPILYDAKFLARRLGLPMLPITPTFPWLGPLGLLPYPVRYRIVYGEPLAFHERFGPDDADDPGLVQYLGKQVHTRVQQLLDHR